MASNHQDSRVFVNILIQIAPNVYKSYVMTDKKGMKQLLVQCQNALYGTMVANLLYYHKFTKSLASIGFEINPYDPCVVSKTVNGAQMTICFHVDDCKLSHHSSKANNNIINWLYQEYESIFEDGSGQMTVSRGRVHKYLRMTLDYNGQVNISMFDYVDEIINAFDKAEPKGAGTKSSAAPNDLFKVNEDHEKLWPEKAVKFHNLVVKQDTICHQMSQTHYMHSYCILDDESASTQQGQLEQTGSPDEISQRHAHAATDP
jgi:hypothetical protein